MEVGEDIQGEGRLSFYCHFHPYITLHPSLRLSKCKWLEFSLFDTQQCVCSSLFVRVPGPDLAFPFLPGLLPVWYLIAPHRPCQSREERMKILIKRDGWIMWLYVNFACQEPSIIIDWWLVLCFQISISAKPVCVTTSGWLGEGAGAPEQGGLIPSLPAFLIPRELG